MDASLKDERAADHAAIDAVLSVADDLSPPLVIRAEGAGVVWRSTDARGSLWLDPLDGTLNWDLDVGDPGFVLAFSPSAQPSFAELSFGYVFGLRSQDEYLFGHRDDGRSTFQRADQTAAFAIECDRRVRRLSDAILYHNDGYGRDFAAAAFRRAGILPLRARHHQAIDNAALEICQLCRGAAHVRVEARSVTQGDRIVGSEHANLLAAFTIGAGAGLVVSDLAGGTLEQTTIDLDRVQDFVCSSNPELHADVLEALRAASPPEPIR